VSPLARVCNAGALRLNEIQWTVSGKVKAVTRTMGSTLQPLEFAYGASGQRISKQVGGAVGDPGTYREHKRPSRSGFWK